MEFFDTVSGGQDDALRIADVRCLVRDWMHRSPCITGMSPATPKPSVALQFRALSTSLPLEIQGIMARSFSPTSSI